MMRMAVAAAAALRDATTATRVAGRRLLRNAAALPVPLVVREALDAAQQQLTRETSEEARAEARTDAKALLAGCLRPRLAHSNDLIFHLDRQLTAQESAALAAATARRSRGEPLAYVLGRKEFWSMEFSVSSDTLIPRADSEVLIETLLSLYPKHAQLRILDVGTGTGCLLLAALSELPSATGVGIDVSPGALRVASENATRHGLADRASLVHCDLADLAQGMRAPEGGSWLDGRFDVVLSNPPYIPRRELALVAPDVLEYEPHLALFSDPEVVERQLQTDQSDKDAADDDDGLRMYRLLHQALPGLLKPKSAVPRSVLVEVGSEAQADAVCVLFASKRSSSTLEFERSELLFDGRDRHRGVLFQALA